jgi:hypothetical protein
MTSDDYGKIRIYDCSCGVHPRRPLRGPPKPCDHCDADLNDKPYSICDSLVEVQELLRRVRNGTEPMA